MKMKFDDGDFFFSLASVFCDKLSSPVQCAYQIRFLF